MLDRPAPGDRLAPVLDRLDADRDGALDRLFALLRIPSISTDPAHAAHCAAAADLLVDDLNGMGLRAERRDTPGRPMVVAHGGTGSPHLLFYGHYDVQPVDPLDLWDRDPFDPEIQETPRGKVIRARGASDDKGQLMTFVEAIRAWIAVHGGLPCKVTVLLEGEEESGSPSLVPFLRENAAELSADVAMICDTALVGEDIPAITTMLRGLVGEEVIVRGPAMDLHSGAYGGAAANPATALCRALAALHDADGRVTLEGFYEGVPEVPAEVKESWSRTGFDEEAFLREVGLSVPFAEKGRSVLEMIWARPTAEVNGIVGGYTGAGFKTVLPAEARAKVSFRLVGDQDPAKVRQAFRAHVRAAIPADCTAEFHEHGGAPASRMALDTPFMEGTRQALSDEWPREAAFIGCGGSIPIAGYFKDILGMESVLAGFAREDDRVHSPNEKYMLSSFQRGARSWARVLDAVTR